MGTWGKQTVEKWGFIGSSNKSSVQIQVQNRSSFSLIQQKRFCIAIKGIFTGSTFSPPASPSFYWQGLQYAPTSIMDCRVLDGPGAGIRPLVLWTGEALWFYCQATTFASACPLVKLLARLRVLLINSHRSAPSLSADQEIHGAVWSWKHRGAIVSPCLKNIRICSSCVCLVVKRDNFLFTT